MHIIRTGLQGQSGYLHIGTAGEGRINDSYDLRDMFTDRYYAISEDWLDMLVNSEEREMGETGKLVTNDQRAV